MVFTWRDKGLSLRHILHPLTKQGLNKNVRSLFIWDTEPLGVLECKTSESYRNGQIKDKKISLNY